MAKILLIEDDFELAGSVSKWLSAELNTIDHCSNGEAGLDRLMSGHYDIVILDIGLPLLDGLTLCRRYRDSGGPIPVLMLTGKEHVNDRVAGFDCGADDYLTKPFSARELSARLQAILRRPRQIEASMIDFGRISIDLINRKVIKDGRAVSLLPIDYAVFEFLVRNRQETCSAETLIHKVWSSDSYPTDNAVRSSIKRIRKALDDEDEGNISIIETVSKLGYRIRQQ